MIDRNIDMNLGYNLYGDRSLMSSLVSIQLKLSVDNSNQASIFQYPDIARELSSCDVFRI